MEPKTNNLDYPIPFELLLKWEREHQESERKANKEIDWFQILDPSEAIRVLKDNTEAYYVETLKICNEWLDRCKWLEQQNPDGDTFYFLTKLYEAEYLPRIKTLVIRAFNLKRLYEKHLALINPQKLLPDPSRITNELIEIAKGTSITDLFIQGGYKLRRQGNNFQTLCPFHQEKTPSCTIYTKTNSYFCFGCRCYGDNIEFVKRTKNLSFPEAVRFLVGGQS